LYYTPVSIRKDNFFAFFKFFGIFSPFRPDFRKIFGDMACETDRESKIRFTVRRIKIAIKLNTSSIRFLESETNGKA